MNSFTLIQCNGRMFCRYNFAHLLGMWTKFFAVTIEMKPFWYPGKTDVCPRSSPPRDVLQKVPSGEERGETAAFARYLFGRILASCYLPFRILQKDIWNF